MSRPVRIAARCFAFFSLFFSFFFFWGGGVKSKLYVSAFLSKTIDAIFFNFPPFC